ncbi:helix-turn-helix transcriptional regulator [Bosea sp. 2KB_26]|jgi:transcriptional regulator with XRE-family HTH domain|uniref:helix-turn-helix domain-containing protein n=1 Tax=unclassified Bosea (in: a-proteobacteria) TaxID=2653178 RepID=UPI000852C9FB|nr:helix-turn-helix transcriptional regulator [Bosea sp. BIWAKO-01]GAU82167.1 transcriptional regulator [Bosea sp. BIWAKO-01]
MLKKIPNPIDRHVGSRVRMRRMLAGVSQEKLGEALGLTFQQVQKYEKGANRISASRLQQIAKMLDVPVSFFFEGAPSGDMPSGGFSDAASTTYISDFLATSEGVQLTKAFVRIKNGQVRRRVIDLVEAIAEEHAEKP